MSKQTSLFPAILKLAKKKRRTIGISLLKTSPEIIRSLKKAKSIADVVVYGKKIPSFPNVPGKGLGLGVRMIQDLKYGKIDQIVRGQVDDLSMVEEAKRLYGVDAKTRRIDFILFRDDFGREWFLTGASNPDLQTLEEKIRVSAAVAKWIKERLKIKPKIAVMATCRPGSYGKDPVMSQTFDEAEATVKHLKKLGYHAENVHIEIERAMEFANLIIPARGTIGNQIFRALLYLSKGQILASPNFIPGKYIYEENSRNETDYYNHIIFAAALANMEK